jgi:hypothetical protein
MVNRGTPFGRSPAGTDESSPTGCARAHAVQARREPLGPPRDWPAASARSRQSDRPHWGWTADLSTGQPVLATCRQDAASARRLGRGPKTRPRAQTQGDLARGPACARIRLAGNDVRRVLAAHCAGPWCLKKPRVARGMSPRPPRPRGSPRRRRGCRKGPLAPHRDRLTHPPRLRDAGGVGTPHDIGLRCVGLGARGALGLRCDRAGIRGRGPGGPPGTQVRAGLCSGTLERPRRLPRSRCAL